MAGLSFQNVGNFLVPVMFILTAFGNYASTSKTDSRRFNTIVIVDGFKLSILN